MVRVMRGRLSRSTARQAHLCPRNGDRDKRHVRACRQVSCSDFPLYERAGLAARSFGRKTDDATFFQ